MPSTRLLFFAPAPVGVGSETVSLRGGRSGGAGRRLDRESQSRGGGGVWEGALSVRIVPFASSSYPLPPLGA